MVIKLFEFIPNFSTSDKKIIDKFIKLFETSNAKLVDYSSDKDHNRTVLTIIGTYEDIKNIAIELTEIAVIEIDLNKHKGVHPRLGAIDVMPFVPLGSSLMDEAISLSKEVAQSISEKYDLPVYLYEYSQPKEYRKKLETIRKGEFEGLDEKMLLPEWRPDYGNNHKHPTAGAVACGARNFLIAFNVNLKTDDVALAQKIAFAVRTSNGGFPCVKALGLEIHKDSKVYAQVSMNLTDYEVTSIYTVYNKIKELTLKNNIEILNCELIGLVPQKGALDFFNEELKLDIDIEKRIIENYISELALSNNILDNTINTFLDDLSSNKPTPGGGSVAALVGSLGEGLMNMVCNFTKNKEKYKNVEEEVVNSLQEIAKHMAKLNEYVNEDIRTYSIVSKAYKMSKETAEEKTLRSKAIEEATYNAILPPIGVMETCYESLKLLKKIYSKFNLNLISDFGVASKLLLASIEGAYLNVIINAKSLSSPQMEETVRRLENIRKDAIVICDEIYNDIIKIMKA